MTGRTDDGGRARRRPVPAYLLATGVLALSTIGDSLFYAIIPAAALHYGLTAAGISIVLSLNRFVRLAVNPFVARWLRRHGLRRGAIAGAVIALASTTTYAVAPGLLVLALGRAAWGVAFSLLRLTMLGYATVDLARAPARLGVASALQALLPAGMLVAGASLLGQIGPRAIFTGLAVLTVLAVPLALLLPRVDERRAGAFPPVPPPSRGAPSAIAGAVAATATISFASDGLVTAGIVLALVARDVPAPEAAVAGGVVLAARKAFQVVVAPLAGRAAQRVGIGPVVTLGLVTAIAGLALAAGGLVVSGALLAVTSAAVVLTLSPAALTSDSHEARLRGLAWVTTARDVGAAAGAALAPVLLIGGGGALRSSWTFGTTAILVAGATALWLRSRTAAA